MCYKLLISASVFSMVLLALTGILALQLNTKILTSFEQRDKHFQSITTAATEISSYAKRAEGHLFLYLAFHRAVDKEKIPRRIAALKEQIDILDNKLKDTRARVLLDQIRADMDGVDHRLSQLLTSHDAVLKKTGECRITTYKDQILFLHERFSQIRQVGVDLAKFEINLENNANKTVLAHVESLRFYTVIFVCFVFIFTLYLGYTILKMIRLLNQEIDSRRHSEDIVSRERDKLDAALKRVKMLSGLLPICAACKKIKDDQGNWNHIETYIKDHSEANFTHGVCPKCASKLYPELDL